MRLKVKVHGMQLIRRMKSNAGKLADGRWKKAAHRGVIDAGRRTKTQVQRAVAKQGNFKNYQQDVVAHMRQSSDQLLSTRIFAVRGGQSIDRYKGLRTLGNAGRQAKALNDGRSIADRGRVRSAVWKNPRVFKRSFEGKNGFFALLPGEKDYGAPVALWSFGKKPTQPRDAKGRFAESEATYGRQRRLFGPSLREEIAQDEALATFHRVAPIELERHVVKRVTKLMRF